jgi:4-carboxymuconolactone decarboxylase
MSEELFELGSKVRRQVLGDQHVDRSLSSGAVFGADFQHYITEVAWGQVWSRPHLDHRTRHMITIAILAATGRLEELELHLRSTPNTGVTPEDLIEVFLHVAAYAGIPAANTGVAIARRFLAEQSGQAEDSPGSTGG